MGCVECQVGLPGGVIWTDTNLSPIYLTTETNLFVWTTLENQDNTGEPGTDVLVCLCPCSLPMTVQSGGLFFSLLIYFEK